MSLKQDFLSKQEEIATKRLSLKAVYAEADKETDPAKRDELAKTIKSANDELADLVDKIEPLQKLVADQERNETALKALSKPLGRQIDPTEDAAGQDAHDASFDDQIMAEGQKSVAGAIRALLDGESRQNLRGYRGDVPALALKTLIQSSDITPLQQRLPGIQLSAQEERTVADLMLSGTTTAQKITYYEETTFTNAAAETAEAAAKPEGALGFTLRESDVRKIATWIPVTDELLEDVPGFESYLRGRLGFMVRAREELQLLQGSGSGQNILGLYNRSGVQTVTGYGLSTIDSILAAITEVQKDAFVEPTAFVVHPNDWFNIRTSKDSNGNYLLGPATLDPFATRPWGLNVRVTTNAIENTGLVGAFNQAQVFRRSGIAIAISTENEDYFIKNKLAVRAEERLALVVYRPAAFCKVEAIVTGS